MQEIRQHILDLHFSKKHANRLTKLILNGEQLLKRQALYDKAQATVLGEDELKQVTDEVGSGCFLSTMSLRDCSEDCEPLWLCGRVNRSGGLMVSNPEVVRHEYVSPDLVSNEYFEMAMDVSGADGFFDGSRNLVNARLFPIYGGSAAFLRVSRPYLFETFAHTLSGRSDIKINEYSSLSAVCGYMIAARAHTEKNLTRLFADFHTAMRETRRLTSRVPSAFHCASSSAVGSSSSAVWRCAVGGTQGFAVAADSKAERGGVAVDAGTTPCARSSKAASPAIMRCIHRREWRSSTTRRHCVIIRGTDHDDDRFADGGDGQQSFDAECTAQRALKKEYLAPFDIPECKALTDDSIDFSAFDPRRCTPSQVVMCAQILSRVRVADLIRAHRFFRVRRPTAARGGISRG